jgi:hypothetical protein
MFTKPRVLITGFAALAAATSMLAVPGASARAAITPQPLYFVALGDSYASGEGDIGSGWSIPSCDLSNGAAPQRAASQLNAVRPVIFATYACSGATVEDVLANDGPLDEMDPSDNLPINALTISIGGNDLNFAGIVKACAAGDSCSTDPSIGSALSTDFTNLGGTTADPGLLGQLVSKINARNDVDNVFVTEYPDPTTGPDGRCGFGGPDPGFDGFDLITEPEAQWASASIVTPLNAALASAVNMANSAPGRHAAWHFVSGMSAAFAGHGFCTGPGSNNQTAGVPRYFNTPTDSLLSQGNLAGSMHPNDLGQQVMANVMYQEYRSTPLLSASVTDSAPPVAGTLANLTVQSLSFIGSPVPGATVVVDGNNVGTTDSTGTLSFNYTFPTSGWHNITVQKPGLPNGQSDIRVQSAAYTASSNPSPVPLNSVIPSLALTATDTDNGQLVAGTFTLNSGTGTVAVPSGGSAANVKVTILGYKTVTEVGPTGKPITIKVPICPTLKFQPSSPAYAPKDFSSLLACTQVSE